MLASSTIERSSYSLISCFEEKGIIFLINCCHLLNIHTIGLKRYIINFKKGAVDLAKASGEILARSFGVISPNNSKRTVVTIVAIVAPYVGDNWTKNRVAIAELAIFTKLFPIKIVDNKESNLLCKFKASLAFLLPFSASFCRRMRLTDVKAVSEEEKNAENKTKMIKNKILLI